MRSRNRFQQSLNIRNLRMYRGKVEVLRLTFIPKTYTFHPRLGNRHRHLRRMVPSFIEMFAELTEWMAPSEPGYRQRWLWNGTMNWYRSTRQGSDMMNVMSGWKGTLSCLFLVCTFVPHVYDSIHESDYGQYDSGSEGGRHLPEYQVRCLLPSGSRN